MLIYCSLDRSTWTAGRMRHLRRILGEQRLDLCDRPDDVSLATTMSDSALMSRLIVMSTVDRLTRRNAEEDCKHEN